MPLHSVYILLELQSQSYAIVVLFQAKHLRKYTSMHHPCKIRLGIFGITLAITPSTDSQLFIGHNQHGQYRDDI